MGWGMGSFTDHRCTTAMSALAPLERELTYQFKRYPPLLATSNLYVEVDTRATYTDQTWTSIIEYGFLPDLPGILADLG
jgi:hypothetical protein